MTFWMIKKITTIFVGVAILSSLIWAGVFYWQNLRGIGPVIKNPPQDIVKLLPSEEPLPKNTTGIPLKLPDGFSISIFAKNLPGARVLRFDDDGNLWVSRTSEGIITRLDIKDGKVVNQADVFKNLRKPHGLVFDPEFKSVLYFAEENKISQVSIQSAGKPEKIADLPYGGGHFTRTLGFGPDGRLYVSIGSSCNICHESDDRRAKIFSMNRDGSDFKEFSRGLRNTVFFTWEPVSGSMWGTDMGRDLLGDDTPPDEINVIQQGKNYGWPVCYGKNVHDDNFDHNSYIRNPCMDPFEVASTIDIPAHSAPLGLAFIPKDPPAGGWPESYRYNLMVSYHGSWNRTKPTGYKVVRIKLDASGNYLGTEDFITGWLTNDGALGRPVDILVQPGGSMFISDDKAGVIYKVRYTAPAKQ